MEKYHQYSGARLWGLFLKCVVLWCSRLWAEEERASVTLGTSWVAMALSALPKAPPVWVLIEKKKKLVFSWFSLVHPSDGRKIRRKEWVSVSGRQ